MKLTEFLKGNLSNLLLAIVAVVFLAACDSSEDLPAVDIETLDAESEAVLESSFEDIENISFLAVNAEAEIGSGRENGTEGPHPFRCAEITRDRENSTIIIDFGDGCEGPGGRIRSGKIIIVYTGRHFEPGSVVTTTMEDFMIDSVAMEGTKIVTNISDSVNTDPKFRIELVGGKATWPDSTFATREADRTKTWFRSENPFEDEFHVDGTANGVKRDSTSYDISILETLVMKRACIEEKVHVPVDGIKLIQRGGQSDMTIDYGDGDCDNIVLVTVDGETEEVDLGNRTK